jgi:hypothetical protein
MILRQLNGRAEPESRSVNTLIDNDGGGSSGATCGKNATGWRRDFASNLCSVLGRAPWSEMIG